MSQSILETPQFQSSDDAVNNEDMLEEYVPFAEYRKLCDEFSGLSRLGVDNEALYSQLTADPQNMIGGMVASATNEALGFPINEDLMPGTERITVLPQEVAEVADIQIGGTEIYRQKMLSGEVVQMILENPDEHTADVIKDELRQSLPEGTELYKDDGVLEYMVLSKYDMSACQELKDTPPAEIVMDNGNIVTSNRERILASMDELMQLHEAVFSEQAMQIGYYGGLHKDDLDGIVNNPEFVPIAGFDGQTGEALMFTLFAPRLTDMSSVPWINPGRVQAEIAEDEVNSTLAMPLVITSKAEGLGMFSRAVSTALHETLYRTKADVCRLLYESSAMSILYTPKIIDRTLKRAGAVSQGTSVEAIFVTNSVQQPTEVYPDISSL